MDVSDYIPHKLPMKLIESIKDHGERHITTATTITPSVAFFDHDAGGVPAWVGLEYMAQSAAAWVGLNDEAHGRPVEPAFLVSSRQYRAHAPYFLTGEHLLTEVKVEFIEGEIVAFSGAILNSHRQVYADAFFTAYRPHDVQDYLRGKK